MNNPNSSNFISWSASIPVAGVSSTPVSSTPVAGFNLIAPTGFNLIPTATGSSFFGKPKSERQVPPNPKCNECGSYTCIKTSSCTWASIASAQCDNPIQPTATYSSWFEKTNTPPQGVWVQGPTPKRFFCNFCRMDFITGPRLHCLNCEDFDLCVACDKLNDEAIANGKKAIHQEDHVFVKLRPRLPKV